MRFIIPEAETLAGLRADPLLFEQELDVGPHVARSLETALGFRAGRAWWRGASGHLYAIELGDFGRGLPSMAIVYGFWPRYEPRPLDDGQINEDLEGFLLWMAGACEGLDPADLQWTLDRAPGRVARS